MDKIQIIEKLFSYILEYSYLLLPICYLFSKSKRHPLIISLVIYGIVFFLFLNSYYEFPKSFRKLQQTIYTFLEYSFFTYIFWYNIRQLRFRKLMLIFSFLFLCFEVVYFISSETQRIDSVPVGIETILILIYAFIYFQQYFNENRTTYIYNDPNFWIVVGVLIYLGSSFFFNILANQVSQEYWYLTFIPEAIKNILFGLSMIRYKNKLKNNNTINTSNVPFLDMI